MTTADYREKLLPKLPQEPGVYKFINGGGEVIYVGKAKNLKNRVSNYFTSGKSRSYKTRTMVKKAAQLEFIIVDSEHDALLLENTLIKKLQPRFNVVFRDDKSYTYICVKNERFPRVFFTRRRVKDGSTYYGPYTSKYKARIVLDLIRQLFQLRTCKLNLSEKNIEAGKFKVCLEYHIENCKGPCEGLESEEEYDEKIKQVKNMLRGNFGDVKRHIKKEMKQEAKQMNYEEAHKWKVRLEAFEDYQSKSTVVSPRVKDVDVYSIIGDEKYAFVNYIRVVNGVMINTYTIELKKNLNEDEKELLEMAILDLRQRFDSDAPEIVVPFEIDYPDEDIKVKIPQRGDKRKLLELSQKNVSYFKKQKDREHQARKNRQTAAERKLKTLKKDLHLDRVPTHIECFDNSNIQGSNPVAACVVFKNAKPSKSDYRKFNIKTVEGPNDFASMEEVVYRRYRRLKEEEEPLPQLVIIDGGKGQLNAAMKSIRKLELEEKIKVIGIAKRLEEIFFPGDPVPLYIDKTSESLKLIQQLRNEAHRFALKFHRDKRSSGFADSELTNIKGVGEKTSRKLLTTFGSVKKIKKASYAEIQKVTGPSVAKKIKNYFASSTGVPASSDKNSS
jgi:excinuclease ABC subunit C